MTDYDTSDRNLVERANQEREDIVRKYDKGREEGAVIDPWEDPQFEVYAVTDRYGFIHNKPLPAKASQLEARAKQLEVERTEKWVKMRMGWEKHARGQRSGVSWEKESRGEKVTRRIYKGIPDILRGDIWYRLLELEKMKAVQDGVYQTMKDHARRWSPDIRQIDLDVNRTYRNHIMFRERYNVKQQHLFHVLAAYSMYNTEVGYCQGMSQVAAILLMYMDEEDAFWGLSALLTNVKYAMHGFFMPGFPKLFRFQQHQDKILKKFMPKLKKHFDKQQVDPNIYTVKWYMQCFLDRVPFHLCLRLWDIYMMLGEQLLVAMSYNLLKMHRKRMLRMEMEELMDFLQTELVRDFGFSDDQVIESLQVCIDELRKAKMLIPPKPADDQSESPQKPFGLFVPPSVEQAIGRRTIESNSDLLQGRRRSSQARESSVDATSSSTAHAVTNAHRKRSTRASRTSDVSPLDNSVSSAASTSLNTSANNRTRDSLGYQTSRTSAWESDAISTGTTSFERQRKSTSRFQSPTNDATTSFERQRISTSRLQSPTDEVFRSDADDSVNTSRDHNRTPINSSRSHPASLTTPTPQSHDDSYVIEEFDKLSRQMDCINAEVSSITVRENGSSSGSGVRRRSSGARKGSVNTSASKNGGMYVKRVQPRKVSPRKESSPPDRSSDYDNLHSSYEQNIDVNNVSDYRAAAINGDGGSGYPVFASRDDGVTVVRVNGHGDAVAKMSRSRSDHTELRREPQQQQQAHAQSTRVHRTYAIAAGPTTPVDEVVLHSKSRHLSNDQRLYNGYSQSMLSSGIQKQTAL